MLGTFGKPCNRAPLAPTARLADPSDHKQPSKTTTPRRLISTEPHHSSSRPCPDQRTHTTPPAEKLIVALSLASAAAMQPKALAVRGGAAVGPIDEALAMNTACTSVVYHLELPEA